jgi:hypothetical protein
MIKKLGTVVDSPDKARNHLVTLSDFVRSADADLLVTMLTKAPMLSTALAPFGGLYLPEAELRRDSYDDLVRIRGYLGGDEPHITIGGYYGDVSWLAHELRNNELVVDVTAIGAESTWDVPWLRRHVIETLLMATGTPLMLLPEGGRFPGCRRAVLAWKSSSEAVRAARDLIALADVGAHIDIVTVTDHADDKPAGHCGIADYLAAHGFQTECHLVAGEGSDAEQLHRFAIGTGADLLAIGAYAHSRFREILLGGVTRTLLEKADIPVLMSR